MNIENFQKSINANIDGRYTLIVREDSIFDVWKDKESGKFIYCPYENGKICDVTEVRIITTLHYNPNTPLYSNDRALASMFTNTCCGEQFNGNNYLWFI